MTTEETKESGSPANAFHTTSPNSQMVPSNGSEHDGYGTAANDEGFSTLDELKADQSPFMRVQSEVVTSFTEMSHSRSMLMHTDELNHSFKMPVTKQRPTSANLATQQ